MKKPALLVLVLVLLAPALFAAPTDEEVALTFAGVFGVYGAVFLTAFTGTTPDAATLDMDMETGASTLTFDDLDVAALFAGIGEVTDGSGEMPEIVFSHISGTFSTDSEGNLQMDVSFRGGPVKTMKVTTAGEDLTMLNADGRDYSHISEMAMMGLGM